MSENSKKTYLELSEDDGVSHKFYEVTVDGCDMTIRYGRIGQHGQVSTKTFATVE
jgi:predicted DNA-binding WGR domain protein